MLYMVIFTINIPPMLAYIPCMDPMGMVDLSSSQTVNVYRGSFLWEPVEGQGLATGMPGGW